MSSPRVLRAFVTERLTAAAEEIAEFFGQTLVKYEEEASESQREIKRLRSLLMDLAPYRTSDVFEEEKPHDDQRVESDALASPLIKEEHEASWGSRASNDSVFVPRASSEQQEDVKPLFTPPTHGEAELQCLDLPGSQAGNLPSSRPPRPSPQSASDHSPLDAVSFFNCRVCDVSFTYKQHLLNHALRVHASASGGVCGVCGDSSEDLRAHLETHRLAKSCHVCGKQCKSASAMTAHVASHTGEKPHRCHFCGKECRRKGDLKIHMRIHTGEKPFSCSYCCKSFTHSGHLTKHMRNHTGERPHSCSVCGRGFLQSAHLKYHLKTHAGKNSSL